MAAPKIFAKAIKKVDRKKIDALVARVSGDSQVYVGVPSSNKDRKEDGAFNNAEVAATMEYGTTDGRIPERPFLRNTIRANLDYFRRVNRVNIIRVLRGEITMEQALNILGVLAAGLVQKFIYSNNYTLAESTIAAKGSSRALVDTAQLAQSITHQIGDN